jgi:formate C-acetyltransferase
MSDSQGMIFNIQPEPLMMKILDGVKTGLGRPAFVGDKSYMEFFLNEKIPLKARRDYRLTGCFNSLCEGGG